MMLWTAPPPDVLSLLSFRFTALQHANVDVSEKDFSEMTKGAKTAPQKQQPKFDADKIVALLDKRDPQRNAATGNAATLSQSEMDALRARLMALWNPPVGIQNPQDFVIRIRIQLGKDRKLSAPPVVLSTGTGTLYNSARDSAVRAVFQAQPFDMLKPEHYETWKDMEMNFDPRDMIRG